MFVQRHFVKTCVRMEVLLHAFSASTVVRGVQSYPVRNALQTLETQVWNKLTSIVPC